MLTEIQTLPGPEVSLLAVHDFWPSHERGTSKAFVKVSSNWCEGFYLTKYKAEREMNGKLLVSPKPMVLMEGSKVNLKELQDPLMMCYYLS